MSANDKRLKALEKARQALAEKRGLINKAKENAKPQDSPPKINIPIGVEEEDDNDSDGSEEFVVVQKITGKSKKNVTIEQPKPKVEKPKPVKQTTQKKRPQTPVQNDEVSESEEEEAPPPPPPKKKQTKTKSKPKFQPDPEIDSDNDNPVEPPAAKKKAQVAEDQPVERTAKQNESIKLYEQIHQAQRHTEEQRNKLMNLLKYT